MNTNVANTIKLKESKERLEKSLQFDVTLRSNEESPYNSNNPNNVNDNNKLHPSDINDASCNVNQSIKNKNLVINSINDTIDNKNNNSLRQPHLTDKIKKNVINSIQDTLIAQKNINNEAMKQKMIKTSKIKKQTGNFNSKGLDNAEIELLEESLVKSLSVFDKIYEREKINIAKTKNNKTVIKHEIYNGIIDRVSSYNSVSKEWSKNAFLIKTRSSGKLNSNHKTNTFGLEKVQNVRPQ